MAVRVILLKCPLLSLLCPNPQMAFHFTQSKIQVFKIFTLRLLTYGILPSIALTRLPTLALLVATQMYQAHSYTRAWHLFSYLLRFSAALHKSLLHHLQISVSNPLSESIPDYPTSNLTSRPHHPLTMLYFCIFPYSLLNKFIVCSSLM